LGPALAYVRIADVIMTETVISFPRSKEGLTKLVRNILGDIVAIAGFPEATVAHTICAPEVEVPLPAQPIDPPTLTMTFRVNDSPLAGTEGTKVTGRMIRDRLLREAEGNVALRISESTEKDSMEVAGRGELQLGILIEQMRREGFELSVSRPKVLMREDPKTGATLEPIENVIFALRAKHPSWGARKLKARLEMLQPDVVWPAASTFGNILSRAGLTSPQRKRKRTTPCSEPFSMVTGPNQLWCMDFKGYFVTGDGKRCDPFTITDAHSRY